MASMSSGGGLQRRRVGASSASGSHELYDAVDADGVKRSNDSLETGPRQRSGSISADRRSSADQALEYDPQLTLMEEILLLGLKDKQACD